MQCLQEKPFEKITITDIHKASTVGRATFYRLFDSLPDVLSYLCDNAFSKALDDEYLKNNPLPDSVTHFLEFWIKNDNLLEVIVSTNHLEILYAAHEKHANELQDVLFADISYSDTMKKYMTGILTSVMVGILTIWITNGKKETATDLKSIMFSSLKLNS